MKRVELCENCQNANSCHECNNLTHPLTDIRNARPWVCYMWMTSLQQAWKQKQIQGAGSGSGDALINWIWNTIVRKISFCSIEGLLVVKCVSLSGSIYNMNFFSKNKVIRYTYCGYKTHICFFQRKITLFFGILKQNFLSYYIYYKILVTQIDNLSVG